MSDNHHRWSDEKLEQFYQEFRERADTEAAAMERVMAAFPNGDMIGHCQYHEAIMRAAEAQARFWEELRLDLAKKSLWGLVTLICGLLLAGLVVKLGIKP